MSQQSPIEGSALDWIKKLFSSKIDLVNEMVDALTSVDLIDLNTARRISRIGNTDRAAEELLAWTTEFLQNPRVVFSKKSICVEILVAFMFIGQGWSRLGEIIQIHSR